LCPTEVTEVVILLQIHHGHVSASHHFISEIPEFGLPKFRNFDMHKRPEILEFGNSGIAITTYFLLRIYTFYPEYILIFSREYILIFS